jgi:hypothetical protein
MPNKITRTCDLIIGAHTHKCHPNGPQRPPPDHHFSSRELAESTGIRYGLYRVLRNFLCYPLSNEIFVRRATDRLLIICRPDPRFDNATDL